MISVAFTSVFKFSTNDTSWKVILTFRSSRPEMFCKKGVLRNFTKFTGKHLCQSLFFKSLRPATLLKKRLWHRCFPVNFVKFLRIPFWKNSSGGCFWTFSKQGTKLRRKSCYYMQVFVITSIFGPSSEKQV